MTISYNWLSKYLPVKLEPARLSGILTSIGLEVESMEKYESVKGSLRGVVIGEVLQCTQHPNADKLKVATVNTGTAEPLQIVCGASNIAVGQKVVVAMPGTTIYPVHGKPVTMKIANIRNIESQGMICAEDELGLDESHAGIMVLPQHLQPGMAAAEYFHPYKDMIFEIGLTPNRMDAMSHLGVARDVCAYLTHHTKTAVSAVSPFTQAFNADSNSLPVAVTVENTAACRRYAGVSLKGITIAPSPAWLQNTLKAIGLRPINNIVDITNYILHETGQPLHAFNADAITGNQVIVKNLPEGARFTTLDEKERTLSAQDLMICNAAEPMCIAGVFGGLYSGVSDSTVNIFLESAWFNPVDIRKTSFRHNLRTDAATRFEKGVDISATVTVLQRAALMIKEIAGGEIASNIVDVYPTPRPQTTVTLSYAYLAKLTGKSYPRETVTTILEALGFETTREDAEAISVKVPFSKTDIALPADLVEEILRIDGFDNIQIPSAITITPSVTNNKTFVFREKMAGYLTGSGFNEIMTNSITNSAFFTDEVLDATVKMMNSLSADLNVMRPSMLETGLQALAYNINRRNTDCQFFEFGKTYHTSGTGRYEERNHLSLYTTGNHRQASWRSSSAPADFYFLKGIALAIVRLSGFALPAFTPAAASSIHNGLEVLAEGKPVIQLGMVSKKVLDRFDIKQPVCFADFLWDELANAATAKTPGIRDLPKQLPVQRDLAVVVNRSLPFGAIEKAVGRINIPKLQHMHLFDVFESEKIGAGKKSMAISFTFLDAEKTLNDKEIDGMMQKIIISFENELQAEIRK